MKKVLITFSLFIISVLGVAQNIGINATGTTPNTSAGLDVDMPNNGLLIPQINLTDTSDVTTITSPANGLLVFNTNDTMTGGNGTGYYYYNGSKWVYMIASDGAGNNGEELKSQGTGNSPQWGTASGGGSITITQQTGAATPMNQNQEITVTHPPIVNEKVLFSVVEEQTGILEDASIGKYGSTADYGIRRISTTQTRFKKQSAGNTANVYLNVAQ